MKKMEEKTERDIDLKLRNRTSDSAGKSILPFFTECPICRGRSESYMSLKDCEKYKCLRCDYRFEEVALK
jgi:hypothetical protein